MILIRRAVKDDYDPIRKIFRKIIIAGDTFLNDETTTDHEIEQMWFGADVSTFVTETNGEVAGAYKLVQNYPGRGAHIVNGTYIVDADYRGQGIGRLMVEHSLPEAKDAGYRAIQFNFVVSTNQGAIRLYEKRGFQKLATLPEAFNHIELGLVDAYVMHRPLDSDFEGQMLFQTDRLLIRKLTAADFDAMYAVYSDPDAMRWVDDGQPISREECAQWIEITQKNYAKYGYAMSAIVLRASGVVIGFCGLVHPGGQEKAEIKYAFLREYWGQGFATEMAQDMIDYGQRAFGLTEIIATIDPDNLASQRVMTKVGMKHVETQENDDGTFTAVFGWTAKDSNNGGGGGGGFVQ